MIETTRKYRYLFADILTNNVLYEFPCYGTSFSRELSGTGNMTATIAMNAAGYNNRDALACTVPGKTALYALCNDAVIWGGPIWSRTYNVEGRALSLTGQTFESWPFKFYPDTDLFYDNIEQRNIVRDLLLQMQAEPRQNALFTIPPEFPTQVTRSENFPFDDIKSYGDLVEYMSEYDQGLDYEIDCRIDANGIIQRNLRLGSPRLGVTQDKSGLLFEFPGSIIRFYFSENAASSAVKAIGVGAGEGSSMLRSSYTHADLGTYPLLQQVYNNKDVAAQATLDSQTRGFANSRRTPIITVSLDIDPSLDPVLGTWSLGDEMHVTLEDEARFPDAPFRGYIRVVGWALTPPSSENKESLQLVLAGEDIAE